jgi:hypothetical protein
MPPAASKAEYVKTRLLELAFTEGGLAGAAFPCSSDLRTGEPTGKWGSDCESCEEQA